MRTLAESEPAFNEGSIRWTIFRHKDALIESGAIFYSGKKLLIEVEACFPDVRKIRLEVEEANDRAVAFYEREGFKQVGTTPDCGVKGSGIPAVIMEKVIW